MLVDDAVMLQSSSKWSAYSWMIPRYRMAMQPAMQPVMQPLAAFRLA